VTPLSLARKGNVEQSQDNLADRGFKAENGEYTIRCCLPAAAVCESGQSLEPLPAGGWPDAVRASSKGTGSANAFNARNG
jgi:hypothetical protein